MFAKSWSPTVLFRGNPPGTGITVRISHRPLISHWKSSRRDEIASKAFGGLSRGPGFEHEFLGSLGSSRPQPVRVVASSLNFRLRSAGPAADIVFGQLRVLYATSAGRPGCGYRMRLRIRPAGPAADIVCDFDRSAQLRVPYATLIGRTGCGNLMRLRSAGPAAGIVCGQLRVSYATSISIDIGRPSCGYCMRLRSAGPASSVVCDFDRPAQLRVSYATSIGRPNCGCRMRLRSAGPVPIYQKANPAS